MTTKFSIFLIQKPVNYEVALLSVLQTAHLIAARSAGQEQRTITKTSTLSFYLVLAGMESKL
ncbi:MAG TPA: hypothetical protein VLI68_07260 [Hanamia sp.]|jgi:hypothetical protein|nr:hypothetical protein [Hanamia sp.]